MKFPTKKYSSIKEFSLDYIRLRYNDISKINFNILEKIIKLLEVTIKSGNTLFVCGNGGSSAISNHFVADYLKYARTNTTIKPKIISLSNNLETITAISNDFNFIDVFSYQLESLGKKGDVLLTISSSGTSKNILKVLATAKKQKIKTISFSGFGGGKAHKIADYGIALKSRNYGIVEDLHHTLMHFICQFIRQKYLNKKISKISF